MTQGQRAYTLDCDTCAEAAALYANTGDDAAAMRDHPACRDCGILLGPAHTAPVGPTCGTCAAHPTRDRRAVMLAKQGVEANVNLSEFRAGTQRYGGWGPMA